MDCVCFDGDRQWRLFAFFGWALVQVGVDSFFEFFYGGVGKAQEKGLVNGLECLVECTGGFSVLEVEDGVEESVGLASACGGVIGFFYSGGHVV